MNRYFFNTENGSAHRDEVGLELESMGAARVAAIRYTGQIMANEPDVLRDGKEFHVQVTDDRGLNLFEVICYVNNAPAAGDTK